MQKSDVKAKGVMTKPVAEGHLPPNTIGEIDVAIRTLKNHKSEWSELPITEYISLLEQVITAISDYADEWVALDQKNRPIDQNHWDAATSYFICPIISLRIARNYLCSLKDIAKYGKPRYPGPVSTQHHQVSIGVFPNDIYDKILFGGFTSEVWLKPDIKENDIGSIQAVNYQNKPIPGVSLVLGAGNVSALAVADILFKLFNTRHVVVLKTHPVLEYTSEIYRKIFKPLIDRGYVQVITGGIKEAEYLYRHQDIDDVHITGSDKTFEAIVFGTGDEGKQNLANSTPKLNKPVSGELGNVSPLIIVPGPWTEKEIAYQAENIASTFVSYCGFYCLTTRVIVQHRSWNLRKTLMDKFRETLAKIPTSCAHYPGAQDRIKSVIETHPTAEQFGTFSESNTPWTLVADLPSDNTNETLFSTECFGSCTSETSIEAASIPEYIAKAVEFCNNNLWGSLSAMIIIHPKSLRDEKVREAFEKAKRDLRYGTICINQPLYISYYIGTNAWGGYPGSSINNIQSGNVMVNNTFMFEDVQKTVTTGPFIMKPTPSWFPLNKRGPNIIRKLLIFEKNYSFKSLLGVLWASLF